MFKQIIVTIVVIFAMLELALAEAVNGTSMSTMDYITSINIEPAMWMAGIAIACAIIHNIGRALDKKRQDPDFKYDYAYMQTTLMAIIIMAYGILDMDIAAMTPGVVLMAISIGFGGNEITARITKVVK